MYVVTTITDHRFYISIRFQLDNFSVNPISRLFTGTFNFQALLWLFRNLFFFKFENTQLALSLVVDTRVSYNKSDIIFYFIRAKVYTIVFHWLHFYF